MSEPAAPRWFTGGDGQRLAADVFGEGEGTAVLLLGGVGQTRHSWRRVAVQLAGLGRRAITMDIRGHGQSEWAADGKYGYRQQAGDILAVVHALGEPVIVAGASLGGKIGFASAALGGPGAVRGLVMVDAVPHSRAEGIAEVTAALMLPADGFASPDEAAAQLAAAQGVPLDPGMGNRLRRNMRQDQAGRWHWHWDARYLDPAQSIGFKVGADYLDGLAGRIKVPVLLARCELSNVVDRAGTAALRALVPQLEVEVIAGARHMLVGDENTIFGDMLVGFLRRHGL